VCCIRRRRAERALDHGGDLIIIDRSRPPWTSLIQEALDAILQKTPTPLPDRILVNAQLTGNRFAGRAIRTPQNNPAAV
jgi:hypothetical protein